MVFLRSTYTYIDTPKNNQNHSLPTNYVNHTRFENLYYLFGKIEKMTNSNIKTDTVQSV